MTTESDMDPAATPEEPTKNRPRRRRLLLLAVLLLIVLALWWKPFLTDIMPQPMDESLPYRTAVASAQADSRVAAAVGDDWQATPVRGRAEKGEIELTIPVSGTDGGGELYVLAEKGEGDYWLYRILTFTPADGETFDLLQVDP